MKVIYLVLALFLTGCNSWKLPNLLETTALAGVGYATGGIAPGLAVGVTSVVANELQPEETVSDIKNTEQAAAFVLTEAMYYGLVGFIVFLLITQILVPYFTGKIMAKNIQASEKKKHKDI